MVFCRACGEPPGDQKQLSESLHKYSEIFYNLTSIKLMPDDDPNDQRICDGCHSKLLDYNNFRSTCLQVHYRLTKIKKENLPEQGEGIEQHDKKLFVETIKVESIEINPEIDTCDEPEHSNGKVESDDESYAGELGSESEEESEPDCKKPKKKKKNPKNKDKSENIVYDCHLCDKKFRSEMRFQGHLRVHQGLKPALCTYCGKDFAVFKNLKLHISRKHTNDTVSYPCDFAGCKMVFASKQGMHRHRKRHDPNYITPEPDWCVCDQCGKKFTTKGALKKHSYIHTGELPFECTVCNKRMATVHKLKEHTMRHEGIKNHVCPYCGMKKTTRHELKVHMNYHTREKLFTCHVCAQVFSSIGNMSRHIKIVHCGIKAFPCPHCDRSFGKAETLKHHVMIHTGEKPHECSVCGKRFIQLVALQTHMKTHRKHQQKQISDHEGLNQH